MNSGLHFFFFGLKKVILTSNDLRIAGAPSAEQSGYHGLRLWTLVRELLRGSSAAGI